MGSWSSRKIMLAAALRLIKWHLIRHTAISIRFYSLRLHPLRVMGNGSVVLLDWDQPNNIQFFGINIFKSHFHHIKSTQTARQQVDKPRFVLPCVNFHLRIHNCNQAVVLQCLQNIVCFHKRSSEQVASNCNWCDLPLDIKPISEASAIIIILWFRTGVTNVFETASCFLCIDWCQGLLGWYTFLKQKFCSIYFQLFWYWYSLLWRHWSC